VAVRRIGKVDRVRRTALKKHHQAIFNMTRDPLPLPAHITNGNILTIGDIHDREGACHPLPPASRRHRTGRRHSNPGDAGRCLYSAGVHYRYRDTAQLRLYRQGQLVKAPFDCLTGHIAGQSENAALLPFGLVANLRRMHHRICALSFFDLSHF
jgi:hypothetical protein